MTAPGPAPAPARSAWSEAMLAAALFAADPAGLGGVALRARAGPARAAWLDAMRAMLPDTDPVRRIPAGAGDEALLGGLDLAATLEAGKPVTRAGLLAELDGGVGVLAMAERVEPGVAARIALAMDGGEASPGRFGLVALDEGAEPDERLPAALAERLALQVDLSEVAAPRGDEAEGPDAEDIAMARLRLPHIIADGRVLEGLAKAAAALGIASLRPPLMALKTARAAAALEGRDSVSDEDAAAAARLVLAPRAGTLPAPPEDADASDEPAEEDAPPDDAPPPDVDGEPDDAAEPEADTDALSEILVEAARAALPPHLLQTLESAPSQARAAAAGRAGAKRAGGRRGRPKGARRGEPGRETRLNVIETLRAAAPWQRLRRRGLWRRLRRGGRVEVRRDDFRVTRFETHSETLTIFVVDASGSLALTRLAEAKGAVELMLADAYVRRDHVALIAFRGRSAELLLPPTRSLTRAKRSLSGLPGGGGTPLADAIDAAAALAEAAARRGQSPALILLTDGQANVARGGETGREAAERDALGAARRVRGAGIPAVLVDASARARPTAESLAREMGARYLRLPRADAAAIAGAAAGLAG